MINYEIFIIKFTAKIFGSNIVNKMEFFNYLCINTNEPWITRSQFNCVFIS